MPDFSKIESELILLGLSLAEHRRKAGLTQKELADACGISREHLAAIESAKIKRPFSVETLLKICSVLEIELKELF